MKKETKKPENPLIATRRERIKTMYKKLKESKLDKREIILALADTFCVSDKTVYADLQLKKTKETETETNKL